MPESLAYHLRHSTRARQLQVRITPWQGIEVVIPKRTSNQRVRAFLTRHRQWIQDTWLRMKAQIPDADQPLPESLALPAVGEHWQIQYRRSADTRISLRETQPGILTLLHDGRDDRTCRETLRRWLARRAREYLTPRVVEYCHKEGFQICRLQIRGQKSRWGSCSSNGTLSLNYKLLFLAPELVRYLLIHELSHTRVLDHSARFWRLVARYEPDWKRLDEELGEAWRDVPAWVEMP